MAEAAGHLGDRLALLMQPDEQLGNLPLVADALHDPADRLVHLLHGKMFAAADSRYDRLDHPYFPVCGDMEKIPASHSSREAASGNGLAGPLNRGIPRWLNRRDCLLSETPLRGRGDRLAASARHCSLAPGRKPPREGGANKPLRPLSHLNMRDIMAVSLSCGVLR